MLLMSTACVLARATSICCLCLLRKYLLASWLVLVAPSIYTDVAAYGNMIICLFHCLVDQPCRRILIMNSDARRFLPPESSKDPQYKYLSGALIDWKVLHACFYSLDDYSDKTLFLFLTDLSKSGYASRCSSQASVCFQCRILCQRSKYISFKITLLIMCGSTYTACLSMLGGQEDWQRSKGCCGKVCEARLVRFRLPRLSHRGKRPLAACNCSQYL